MKLRLLLLHFCLLLSGIVTAQTTLNFGTATTNPAGSNTPFTVSSTGALYTRNAIKYDNSHITLNTGVLKKIRWYKTTSAGISNVGQQLRIYAKTSQFSWNMGININWVTEISGATLVYSNNNQNINAGTGWQEFELQVPYTYNKNGSNDLAIFVEWFSPGPVTSALKWAAPSSSDSHYQQNANGYPADLMNGGTSRKPSTQMDFDPLPQNDAGISALLNPGSAGLQTGVVTPIEVRIKNYGDNDITSATINWSINGVAGTPFAYSGLLASQTSQPVVVGSHTFTAGNHTIKTWTSNPNNTTDGQLANDTLTVQVQACSPLSGAYTITPGSPVTPTNFNSIADALQTLHTCGVSGPVTISLAPNSGPFTEKIELTHVPGMSATNSITLNGQGNTLEPLPQFGELPVIKLDSASHITITDFNIVVTNTALGFGIQLINHSNSVTISNCIITVPQNINPSLAGILVGNINTPSATPRCSYLSIINNTITGAEAGILVNQNSNNTTGTDAQNLFISGNTIRDFRQYGIKLATVAGAVITKNNISRPNREAPGKFFGIHAFGNTSNCLIEKNRIHNPVGGVPVGSAAIAEDATGIYWAGDATVGQENIFSNNLIYNLNNSGNAYGIYNNGADGTHFFHNTIDLQKSQQVLSPNVIAGLYQTGAATNISFVNNIVTLQAPGTAIKSLLYFNSSSIVVTSNHNVLWPVISGTGAAPFVSRVGSTNFTSLASWQATAGSPDANSLSANPDFVSAASANFMPQNAIINNTGLALANVPDDLNNVARHITNPDPGAYEFSAVTGLPSADEAIIRSVWPNPFTTTLNLDLVSPGQKIVKIYILDNVGKLVYENEKTTNEGLLTLKLNPNLKAGLYLLKIITPTSTIIHKLMKQ